MIFLTNCKLSSLYYDRPCMTTDYNNGYYPFCGPYSNLNVTDVNIYDYGKKPRTPVSQNAFFPMQMKDRQNALSKSNTAFFVAIVVVQIADLLVCKTRLLSYFEQGMSNSFMNFSILCEITLTGFLVYLPFVNTVAGTSALIFVWWVSAFPFAVWIFVYDELRKSVIRQSKKSFLKHNTLW